MTDAIPVKIVFIRTLSKNFRKTKEFLLRHSHFFLSKLFFRFAHLADLLFSARKLDTKKAVSFENTIWKQVYFTRFGLEPHFRVETNKPVAVDSSDHQWPRGTLYDNSKNRNFNLKSYYLFRHQPNLRVMDLGCSGGGMVRSFLEDGHTAIGLEGSDVSKKLRSAEWDTCPLHLFTCDITSPFKVKRTANDTQEQFDLITSWEVLEHIPENRVDMLIENIAEHLRKGGVFVGSVATFLDFDPNTGANYHVTLKPKEWWLERFARKGLTEVPDHPYKAEDFVRGNGLSLKDWYPGDGFGFHLVLRKI